MSKYSIEQRVFIVKTFYKGGELAADTLKACKVKFGKDYEPDPKTVKK